MDRRPHSDDLKIHTRDVHVQLEQRLIPVIQSINTRSQYADLLKLFYAFYTPLELRLSAVPGIEKITGTIQLRKADSLKNDIIALGSNTDSALFCNDLPECGDLGRAFGIMYVLEGSVLGGKAIANIIAKKLAPENPLPFSFFLPYGNEPKVVWDHFKATLDATDLSKAALLAGATDTFVLFRRWIDGYTDRC